MQALHPDAYPRLLPHAGFAADGAWLGAGPWTEVPADAAPLCRACDGRTAYRDLRERFPGRELPAAALEYVVWLDRPLPARAAAAAAGERVVVLSPHPHVGFLSMGGYLLNQRGRRRCAVVSCFSQVATTLLPEAFDTVHAVSAIRRDEAALCARIAGCEVACLDFPADEIRLGLVPEDRLERAEERLRSALTQSLYRLLAAAPPADLFAPAGMGEHSDHKMLFEIALDFFKQGWFPATRFHFYEDFPFAAAYLHADDFLSRFERTYAELEVWAEDVSGVLGEKLLLLDIHRSLFAAADRRRLERLARRDARLYGGEAAPPPSAVEPFWSLAELGLPA